METPWADACLKAKLRDEGNSEALNTSMFSGDLMCRGTSILCLVTLAVCLNIVINATTGFGSATGANVAKLEEIPEVALDCDHNTSAPHCLNPWCRLNSIRTKPTDSNRLSGVHFKKRKLFWRTLYNSFYLRKHLIFSNYLWIKWWINLIINFSSFVDCLATDFRSAFWTGNRLFSEVKEQKFIALSPERTWLNDQKLSKFSSLTENIFIKLIASIFW